MNFGVLIITILLVLAGIEVLVGVKRGGMLTGVRALLWILLTFVAAKLAIPIARAIVTGVIGNGGTGKQGLYDSMKIMLIDSGLEGAAPIFAAPLAGVALSLVAPFVFVVLFIVMKFLSWILYLIAKKIISKTAAGEKFTEKTTVNKVIGGVAGFLIGVAACAIIASPVSCLIKTIDDSGAVDSAFHIAGMAMEMTETLDSGNFTIEDAQAAYNSVVHSPASYLCRYTGTEWIAMKIYNSISTVSPKQIGTEKEEDITYSFPTVFTNFLSISNKIDRVMTLFHDGKRYCVEVLDSLEDIVFYFLDVSVITDSDKLTMLNNSIESIEEAVESYIGFGDDRQIFKPFDSYEQFREDIRTIFAIARIPASLFADRDASGLESIFDLKTVELMGDDRFIGDFVHLMFKLNSGSDVIAAFINNAGEALSTVLGSSAGDLTTPELVAAAGEDTVIQACRDLAYIVSEGGPTLSNQAEFTVACRRLIDSGLFGGLELKLPGFMPVS